MEYIPNEILFQILSYLEIDDRKDKRSVNKLWNQIIPSLPLTLSQQKKEELLKNIRRISIQIHFVRDIVHYVFEEEYLSYTFSNKNENLLLELSMDSNFETIGNDFRNVNIESSRWEKIKSDLDEIFETGEGLIETYVDYMNHLISNIPEIKYITSDDMKLDVETIKNTIVKDVMAVLKNNKKYFIQKDHIFQDIFVLDILENYRDIMNKWRNNILKIFAPYSTSDSLVERYISNLIQ